MTLLKRGITRIVPLAVIILGRDVLLSLSAFYIRYTSLPPPVRAIRCFFDLTNSTTHGIPENLGTILGLLITFSVGNLNGRTLVIYMKKKGVSSGLFRFTRAGLTSFLQLDSVFRVLEPVIGKINERAEAPRSFGSRLGLRSQRSEWFRVYRVRIPGIQKSCVLTILPGFLPSL